MWQIDLRSNRDILSVFRVVEVDQSWLKKELNIKNIMILILFYGNVCHYYIHDYNYKAKNSPYTSLWLACSNT